MNLLGEADDGEVFFFCLGVRPTYAPRDDPREFFATTTHQDVPPRLYPDLKACFRLPRHFGLVSGGERH